MSAALVVDNDEVFPRAFGSYLLLQNFARGGMGEVFLAKSGGIAGLERTCVLKKLRPELTRDREYVTRFIDEARVVVTLSHANICNVFDVGRVNTKTSEGNLEEYYLAMDYVSGRDLRTMQDRCRKQQRAPTTATALHLVCQTLQALNYAHRRTHPNTGEALNLVHRDVSPQNVLVSFEGEVKLIDFGLAASRLKVERTQPNVVMGKMAYMAPEHARGNAIDARADLFACGVMCYELLANERFYEGMTANDILQVAGRGGFVPHKWKELEPVLAEILRRAVHPDVNKRFSSCAEFSENLLAYSHSRWPGVGESTVRALMAELFVEEIARERVALANCGGITLASFQFEIESTRSNSLILAHNDRGPAPVRLVKDEFDQQGQPTATRPEGTPLSSSGPAGLGPDTLLDIEADEPAPLPHKNGSPIHNDETVRTTAAQRALRSPAGFGQETPVGHHGPLPLAEGGLTKDPGSPQSKLSRPQVEPTLIWRGVKRDTATTPIGRHSVPGAGKLKVWGGASAGVALLIVVLAVGVGSQPEVVATPLPVMPVPLENEASGSAGLQASEPRREPVVALSESTITPKSHSENASAENKIAENKIAENKITENKITENKITENKIIGNKSAGNKSAGNKIVGNKIVENKIAENKIAENEIAGDKVPGPPVVDSRLFRRIMSSKHACVSQLIAKKTATDPASDEMFIQRNGESILSCAQTLGLK